jgi:hypothetical protein
MIAGSHFDIRSVPTCGARNRSGNPCRQPGMANGRCRLHGGKSTGPRTPEGLERARKAALRHGGYTAEAKAMRRLVREMRAGTKRLAEIT